MVLQHMHTDEVDRLFCKLAYPILTINNVMSMERYIQHGKTSCLKHCMGVAYYSLFIVNTLKINCDKESLIRGALLHDYFLYDWHEKDRSHSMHGFRHPKTSLNNALQDFDLNAIECDIIIRHMFPLVPIPPRYIESIVVCVVDKLCSLFEIFCLDPYFKMPDAIKSL